MITHCSTSRRFVLCNGKGAENCIFIKVKDLKNFSAPGGLLEQESCSLALRSRRPLFLTNRPARNFRKSRATSSSVEVESSSVKHTWRQGKPIAPEHWPIKPCWCEEFLYGRSMCGAASSCGRFRSRQSRPEIKAQISFKDPLLLWTTAANWAPSLKASRAFMK